MVPVGDGECAGGAGSARSAPHFPQNAKSGGFSKSQCGQRGLSLVPQRPQKFMPAGFSKPQLGQCMGPPSGTAVERLGCKWQTFQYAPLTSVYGMRCEYSRWGQLSSEK